MIVALQSGDGREDQDSRDGAIIATPFILPDPASLPPRRWLLGKWFQRGEVTAIGAPGGVGKSTLMAGTAMSLASGADLFEKGLPEGACRVWVWNLEDDREELARQFAAAALHHGITADALGNRLFVDGLDKSLCTAVETTSGAKIIEPVYEAVTAEIRRRGVDILKIDPFVSSHNINENDNGMIDAIVKRWKRVAQDCQCAIALVHHTRKTGNHSVTVEDLRGGSSLSGAVRTVLTLNPMREDEATSYGITDRAERRTIIRVDNGKSNRAPPENAFWFKIHSVDLGNGSFLQPSDRVGAAALWSPPDAFEGLSVRDLYNVQLAIDRTDDEQCRENSQAQGWVGQIVAETLDLNVDNPSDKARIKQLLKTWISKGALTIDRRPDPKGKGKIIPYVMVGNWIDPATLPTTK